MQCAIRHPARQGGVCGFQEWSGVHGLQGKEWPFDGGECRVKKGSGSHNLKLLFVQRFTLIYRSLQEPSPDDAAAVVQSVILLHGCCQLCFMSPPFYF